MQLLHNITFVKVRAFSFSIVAVIVCVCGHCAFLQDLCVRWDGMGMCFSLCGQSSQLAPPVPSSSAHTAWQCRLGCFWMKGNQHSISAHNIEYVGSGHSLFRGYCGKHLPSSLQYSSQNRQSNAFESKWTRSFHCEWSCKVSLWSCGASYQFSRLILIYCFIIHCGPSQSRPSI